ncbi:hypothetical protein F5Y16DRAFT_407760 [Xylariaceae sp. FL0255]|nr:hypothetical protein F5Y16DRAFT_407760 [Xylariaceae sp. FL0255]
MLGWALKSGLQGVTGIRDTVSDPDTAGDTTQIDAPDTPAPVFAARAIKNALWGQSTESESTQPAETVPTNSRPTDSTTVSSNNMSPTKQPNSILLTPGTGTSRPKKVSFDHDVKHGSTLEDSPLASASTANGNGNGTQRKKTSLQTAFENSRSSKTTQQDPQTTQSPIFYDPHPEYDTDDEPDDEENFCKHDVTVDLNEPHSESGKYWKAEFSRYRDEAKIDIEHLIRYKAMAKSYAAKRDAEANQLTQKLKEAQETIAELEDTVKKLKFMGRRGQAVGTKNEKSYAALQKTLDNQTALTLDYRRQVTELRDQVEKVSLEHSFCETTKLHKQSEEGKLVEVNRQLRKAQSELRQVEKLRDNLEELKSDLASAQERVAALEAEKKLAMSSTAPRVQKLESQLREAKARKECRHKDATIRKLRRENEYLKDDSMHKSIEATEVRDEKDAEIGILEAKIRNLESANAVNPQLDSQDAPLPQHNKATQDLRSGIESLNRSSRYETARPVKRHLREVKSMEDMDLDTTQRSLLRDRDEQRLDQRRAKAHDSRATKDWKSDILDRLMRRKSERKEPTDSSKHQREAVLEAPDTKEAPPPRSRVRRPIPDEDDRAPPDVLTDRINEASRKESRKHEKSGHGERVNSDGKRNFHYESEDTGMRKTNLSRGRPATYSGSDHKRRHSKDPMSPKSDPPRIDLVQDQYSRLGAPQPPAERTYEGYYSRLGAPRSVERTPVGNTSRCGLSADRQAAARARLEQKKLDRQRASDRPRHKENVPA